MGEKIDAERQRNIFSRNLNYYMERTGKTTSDISADLSFPFSTVSDWVHGKKYPRMDKVQALADYFGILKSHLTEEKEFLISAKNPPSTAEAAPGEDHVSMEESNRLLVALGLIEEGQDLSDDDLAFLEHVIGLLDAWFRKGH